MTVSPARCLDEVADLDASGQQLAADLRRLVQNYDMEGIVNILTEIDKRLE